MQKGDIINGYRILRDFSTAGGGLSKWSFAEKGGKEYFIKEFLSPKYPTEDAPGSAKSKERKRRACERFENHHRALMDRINERCGKGGNLVFTIDFFRVGTTYYKVTEKIDTASLSPEDISRLPLSNRLLILKTIAHSLQILHRAGIVHGDLKPGNILIKQTKTNLYTTKLIDFDNSYLIGQPPEFSEDLVGDMVFYSPEVAAYVQGSEAVTPEMLTDKADIFSLGLVFCLYLTGELPKYPAKYGYPALAAWAGHTLRLPVADLPYKLKRLVNDMLRLHPHERPDIATVFDTLKSIKSDEPYERAPLPEHETAEDKHPAEETPPASPLKGTLLRKVSALSAGAAGPDPAESTDEKKLPESPEKPTLRGKGLRLGLGGKDEKDIP
ncbi:serine/threonine protein kinase [Thermonema rossianum]|uniref:serine/threonine protein kinase n=1 Tax=Thermonema rossianum TaxID=55505 RepID=UPI00068A3684|nr:protein kinase [Thermonema rossianum]